MQRKYYKYSQFRNNCGPELEKLVSCSNMLYNNIIKVKQQNYSEMPGSKVNSISVFFLINLCLHLQ